MAVARAAAIVLALSVFETEAVIRCPPMYKQSVPSAVAGPLIVTVPVAITPESESARTRIHVSVDLFIANHAFAIR
jgi:hypothetical protein